MKAVALLLYSGVGISDMVCSNHSSAAALAYFLSSALASFAGADFVGVGFVCGQPRNQRRPL